MIVSIKNKFDICLILCYLINMKDLKAIRQIVDDLFALKTKYRYSFKELAEMFHVDPKTISRWFNKESVPQPVYVPMIKKLIEIDKEKSKNYKDIK